MPRTETTYRAKWESPFPEALTKAERVDTRKLLTKSILSRLEFDLAGDKVNPTGIDWTLHQADHWIDLEHGRDLDVGDRPVAWAKESLANPDAPYAVEYKSLNFAKPKEPALWETVPIGTDYFDPKSKLSMQIFAMREQDALPYSSIEFLPVRGHFKAIGRTTLEPRPCMPDPYAAYQFDRCRVVRWTICAKGVCPHAMTLTKSARTNSQVPGALEKILRDERVNINGTLEKLHPYILKALASEPTKRTTVHVGKAMSPDYQTADTAAPTTDAPLETESAAAVDDMAAEEGPTPTAQAAYDLAQGASDLQEQISRGLKRGEHKSGRKKMTALLEKLGTISELAMEVGKQVDADTMDENGGSDDEETDSEGDDAEETAEGDADNPVEETSEKQKKALRKAVVTVTAQDMMRGEDGVLNGIPQTIKKSVKRFTLRDLSDEAAILATPLVAEVQKADESSEEFKRAYAEFKKWQVWAKPKS